MKENSGQQMRKAIISKVAEIIDNFHFLKPERISWSEEEKISLKISYELGLSKRTAKRYFFDVIEMRRTGIIPEKTEPYPIKDDPLMDDTYAAVLIKGNLEKVEKDDLP